MPLSLDGRAEPLFPTAAVSEYLLFSPAAMSSDPYNLARFLKAQGPVYEGALAEIRAGRKRSHWMWYVFPQVAGLGHSPTSVHYAIGNTEEAEVYLAHPILGPRLIECAEAVLQIKGRSPAEVFGSPDDMKLRSSATLFAAVSPEGSVFHRIIEKHFDDEPDARTIELIGKARRGP
jgi:uncharacterized protein (DUF1810 family)